ncbi:alpha-E domain-containing protein [Marinagarivorans algicola]|uniref:alpha-E domain-containing protein n=1 Tax=Marinagarivorans algicola TaxID=1513270 RepID=UPI0006B65577|nr:alpha-E domain-containing protein [Marinagarivorans algicola]
MLSKVAERVYWTARYLERIESTARLISIYDKLLFDLPRTVQLSWYNLITINSLQKDFSERYAVQDERNVIKFLIGDESNYSSIVSSLKATRENIRTTRDVIPSDVWYAINELNRYVKDNIQQGINRGKRHEFLSNIICGCQQILGTLYSDMPHDAAWTFLRIGRNLERADMTSRNIDAAMAGIMEAQDIDEAVNTHQIIWLNLLRSLNADHSYRRATRQAIKGYDVVGYLVTNQYFPKSIEYCLNALISACEQLPNSENLTEYLDAIKADIVDDYEPESLGQPLRDDLNELQLHIIDLHKKISETWFPVWD